MFTKIKNEIPKVVLKKYFGYNDFRPGQLEIINSILNKKDTLSILPTGGGKSICFQVPGILLSAQTQKAGVTLVISPLISLMKDQVDTLNSKNIPSCYISGLLNKQEIENKYDLIKLNKFKFIYIAPERLESARFQKIISSKNICLVVIDEAHCISQWGNDFRPSYKKISTLLKKHTNSCPIAAFTATANKKTQVDICNTLKLNQPSIYYKSFKRTNLNIEVIKCHNRTIKNLALLRLLKKHQNQVGIIYCSTRKSVSEISNFLKDFNISSEYYHGGLDKKTKSLVQLSFCNGGSKIIVATNAFGMGIDVGNIRFVIHYQIPGDIENYYQEIGRAGRDGLDSNCYTLYYESDIKIQNQFAKNNQEKNNKLKLLNSILINNKCRTQQILKYFGEKSKNCNKCDVCKKTIYKSQLMIHINNEEIFNIKKVLNLQTHNYKNTKKFPITNTLTAFIAIKKPKNKEDLLKIPGVGKGFLNAWSGQIQQLFV
jgi:ATP-dependent DNA helicase RecQ